MAAFPWAAAIGAGAQLAGGLLGDNAQKDAQKAQNAQIAAARKIDNRRYKQQYQTAKKQYNTARADTAKYDQLAWDRTLYLNNNRLQMLQEDARKAGIHPLAALGASTVGPMSQSVAASPNVGSPDTGGVGTGGTPSSGSAFGEGLGRAGAMFAEMAMQQQAQSNELEMAKQRAEIAMLQQATSRSMIENAMMVRGSSWVKDPGWSDADAFEQRYGELTDWIIGPQIAMADAFYNWSKLPNLGEGKLAGQFKKYGVANTTAAYINKASEDLFGRR